MVWQDRPVSFYTTSHHGPLTRYEKLRVAQASEMPGTFSPPVQVSDPNMHPCTCVTHVPWCMSGSLTSSFIWSRWRGKHSQRMRNPQFCVSGKRPIEQHGGAPQTITSREFPWVITYELIWIISCVFLSVISQGNTFIIKFWMWTLIIV